MKSSYGSSLLYQLAQTNDSLHIRGFGSTFFIAFKKYIGHCAIMKLPVGPQRCLKNKKRAMRSTGWYVLDAFVIGLSKDAREMLVDGPSL